MPLRYTPRLIADLALHPCWCWQILCHGSPQLKNLARSSRMPENIAEQAAALSRQMDLTLTWDDLPWLRRHWPGKVVIKGIQTLADARKRSEEHTSELQSLMRISYAVFCLKKKNRP